MLLKLKVEIHYQFCRKKWWVSGFPFISDSFRTFYLLRRHFTSNFFECILNEIAYSASTIQFFQFLVITDLVCRGRTKVGHDLPSILLQVFCLPQFVRLSS